jgi:hypothetical protein
MVYDKYARVSYENGKFKRKSRTMIGENHYLLANIKTLEIEKRLLESKLVSTRNDPNVSYKVVSILGEQ